MEKQLQAIVTVLSLVNPLICGAMFAQIDAGQSRAIQCPAATAGDGTRRCRGGCAWNVGRDGASVPEAIACKRWAFARYGTQFMGLIVLAMGVQFALTGFQDFLLAQR
jgi:hypothetical protein